MSMIRCDHCNTNIDTDFNAEHFEECEQAHAEHVDEQIDYSQDNILFV